MTPEDQQDDIFSEAQKESFEFQKEARIAMLKVQSYQFARKTPEVGSYYQQETAKMVRRALLSFVPNSFVLDRERYHYKPLDN